MSTMNYIDFGFLKMFHTKKELSYKKQQLFAVNFCILEVVGE